MRDGSIQTKRQNFITPWGFDPPSLKRLIPVLPKATQIKLLISCLNEKKNVFAPLCFFTPTNFVNRAVYNGEIVRRSNGRNSTCHNKSDANVSERRRS